MIYFARQRRTRHIIASFILGIGVSACALTDAEVTLEPATFSVRDNGNANKSDILLSFQDIRKDKSSLGAVRNGYMTQTANVVSKNDAAAWVRESLNRSLKRAGYRVQSSGEKLKDTSRDMEISVRLYRVYSDITSQFSMSGEVQAIVVATRDGKKTAEKLIEGVGTVDASAAISGSYQEVLELALEDFVLKSVDWIRGMTATRPDNPSVKGPSSP